MQPQTGSALLILGAFVMPGFITTAIRERTHVISRDVAPFRLLLQSLYYAAIVYLIALLAFATVGISGQVGKSDLRSIYHGHAALGVLILAGSALLFVIPLAVAEVSRRWHESKLRTTLLERAGINVGHQMESAWNQAFVEADPSYVKVSLADGRVIGGQFSGKSLIAYSQHAGDLYLAKRIPLDDKDWFTEPADGTLGVWIARDQIASVEFYEMRHDDIDDAGHSTVDHQPPDSLKET